MGKLKGILSIVVLLFVLVVVFYNNASVKLAKDLESNYENDGQTIELEGKLKAPFLTRAGASTTKMELEVCNDFVLIQNGNTTVTSIQMNYGEGKNSVLITTDGKKFEDKDVVVYDKNGNKLTLSDKVKLTGKLKYTHKGEKKETTGKEDFSYEITDVTIEKI